MGYTIKKTVSSNKKKHGLLSNNWDDESVKLEKHEDQIDAIQRILDLMNATIDKGWKLRRADFSFQIKDTEEETKLFFVHVNENS